MIYRHEVIINNLINITQPVRNFLAKSFERRHETKKCAGVSFFLPQKVNKGKSIKPNLFNLVLVNTTLL